MNPKVALVLSGGGAKGAFQFGVLKYLEEQVKPKFPGFQYNIIAGVSVGALNAAMMAMEKFQELEDTWNTVSNDTIYSGNHLLSMIWRVLIGKKSLLSNAPLWDRIKRQVHLADVNLAHDLRIGLVSLTSGQYHALTPADFNDDLQFQKAVLGSTAIPVLWEPVQTVALRDGRRILSAVDGGVRNVAPLGDVLDDDPTHIIIINCSPPTLGDRSAAGRNLLKIAERSITDIMVDEIFNSDVNDFLRINRLVNQAEAHGLTLLKDDGSPYKCFHFVKIEPDTDIGDSLDFTQETTQWRIAKGIEVAEKQFRGFSFP